MSRPQEQCQYSDTHEVARGMRCCLLESLHQALTRDVYADDDKKRTADSARRQENSHSGSTVRLVGRSSHTTTHKAAGPPSGTNLPPVNVHGIIVPIGRRPSHVDGGVNLGDREHAAALLPAPPRSRRGPGGARPTRVIPRCGGSVRRCTRYSAAWPRTASWCLHRVATIRAAPREQQQRE